MRIQFGAGQLYLNPNGGNTPVDFTPQWLATLQDVNIDIQATIKDLRGQYQFPDDTAISDRKITWKTGFGRFDIDAYNNLYFGESAIQTGGDEINVQEAHNVPTTGGFTITTTNAAEYAEDLGVIYAATGQKFTRLPSGSPAVGQYTVNQGTGVYTFAAADAGVAVLITYTSTIATGRQLTVLNHTQGYGPSLELFLSLPYQEFTAGVPNYCHLFSCKVSKLGQPFKRADYLITDIEGEAYSNAAGQVATFYED